MGNNTTTEEEKMPSSSVTTTYSSTSSRNRSYSYNSSNSNKHCCHCAPLNYKNNNEKNNNNKSISNCCFNNEDIMTLHRPRNSSTSSFSGSPVPKEIQACSIFCLLPYFVLIIKSQIKSPRSSRSYFSQAIISPHHRLITFRHPHQANH